VVASVQLACDDGLPAVGNRDMLHLYHLSAAGSQPLQRERRVLRLSGGLGRRALAVAAFYIVLTARTRYNAEIDLDCEGSKPPLGNRSPVAYHSFWGEG
jgi:hypothetical protein